jgi:hypothetical protein
MNEMAMLRQHNRITSESPTTISFMVVSALVRNLTASPSGSGPSLTFVAGDHLNA